MYHVVGCFLNAVKRVVFTYIICRMYLAKTAQQKMGKLPFDRVTMDRPFNKVGVDLAGPFSVKCAAHRSTKFSKIYAAIFVCMATKCVHIKVLSALFTEAFVATLDRFIARRGVPSVVFSDNATNFVGTSNLLSASRSRDINWQFIPPLTPHQGGIWEAAVKCAKWHLFRSDNCQTLSHEEYGTIFASIESRLNSMPLCQRSSSVLTPAHFLVGSNLLIPSLMPLNSEISLGQRYTMQRNINSFWNRWSKDYLNQIRNAAK